MRIAFVGLPLAALLLRADGHTIVWAGICRRDAIGLRRLKRHVREVAIVPDLANAAEHVRALAPDLVVSWFWTKKIPRVFRTVAPVAFGVHPSLLPRHRGPDPYFWAIDAGDTETGVSAHAIEDEYDTGAILGQKTLALDPKWNAWTLAKKLDRPSLSLLRETTTAYASGTPPEPRAQDASRATEAPAPDDEMLEIRWNAPAAAIVRRIRAASPWPGAFTEIAEEVVSITDAEVTANVPRALAPGEAAVVDGRAVVRAGDAGVVLLRGRLDDDTDLDTEDLAEAVRSDGDEGA